MLGLGDNSVLEAFERDEIADPSPRNIYPDRTIYQSRAIARPKAIGLPVLSDLGLARFKGGIVTTTFSQRFTEHPRSCWTWTGATAWTSGTLASWYGKRSVQPRMKISQVCLISNLCSRSGMFSTTNICLMLTTRSPTSSPTNITFRKWQHILAHPREDFWKRARPVGSILTDQVGSYRSSFLALLVCLVCNLKAEFSPHPGRLVTGIDLTDKLSLEAREERFEGEKKEKFLNFIRSMLQWDPKDRLTARELLDDPWLNDYEV